ncbi:MAG: hypothetical protein HUU55_18660 [Myxococcales bacterium]|nr:hypothetical protein [Myxococcales bacterium]
MLPENTPLGKIEISEVYEYLDGPRLFTAINNVGTMFLVFWCGEESDATRWLYLPVSEEKLNKLRRKKLTLRAAFVNPETAYYLAYTAIPPRQDSAIYASRSDIDQKYFPPDGFYIEYVDVVSRRMEGWCFEIILRGDQSSAEVLSQFIGRFRELFEGIMPQRGSASPRLYPHTVLQGSTRIKFGTDSDVDAMEALRFLGQLLKVKSDEEFRQQLIDKQVDSSRLRDFFGSILRNRLDVEIAPKLATNGEPFNLPKDDIEKLMARLDRVDVVFIDTLKVPQANDIDKMIDVLQLIHDGTPLSPENIGVTAPRQVDYYTTAAYAYGLATKEKQLTVAGHFLISHPDKSAKYQILADRFESTDFGWAWMKWAGVKSMTTLDPDTAETFLRDSVLGLSSDTARRRASTLRIWLQTLQPYHRNYSSTKSLNN